MAISPITSTGMASGTSAAAVSTRIGIASGKRANVRIPSPTPHFETSSITAVAPSRVLDSEFMASPFISHSSQAAAD
jgi:hypothetical protein